MYYIVGGTAAAYLIQMVLRIPITYYLAFIPGMIMEGQIWRVISFVFIPPASSMLFIFFVLYFYYMIGTTLENEWGSFKFNLYYLFGMVGTIIAAFITGYGTSFYLNLSLFLGFAYLFPDVEVHLFLILPIKIKWLAYLNWAFFAFTILFGSMGERLAVIASLINFFIFFGKDLIDYIKFRRRYGNTRKNFKREMKRFKRY